MAAKDSGRDRNANLYRMDSRNLSPRDEFSNSQNIEDLIGYNRLCHSRRYQYTESEMIIDSALKDHEIRPIPSFEPNTLITNLMQKYLLEVFVPPYDPIGTM